MYFFSRSHGIFTKIEHMLDDKTHLSKFRKEIINLLSDHNVIKLESNNRKRTRKSQIMWRLNNTLLSNTWNQEEILRDLKMF